MELESEVGHGSLVSVTLLEARPPRPRDTSNDVCLPKDAQRGYLLAVDDEPMLRATLQRTLGTEHTLIAPSTAVEALALIDAGMRFDLILCDVMMPELSGQDFYEALARRHPDQARRTIFLTGGAVTSSTVEFLRSVPNECIEKPFQTSHLKHVVAERLRQLGTLDRRSEA